MWLSVFPPLTPLTLASVCVCGDCVRPCTLTPHLVDLCRRSIRFVLFSFSYISFIKSPALPFCLTHSPVVSLFLWTLFCLPEPLTQALTTSEQEGYTCARIKTVLLMMLLLVNKRRHQINLCLSLLTTQRYCSSGEDLDSGIYRKPGMCNSDVQQETKSVLSMYFQKY